MSTPAAPSARSFTPALFKFLRDLQDNNDRDWFNENKQRWLDDARDPCLRFVTDFGERLNGISPHFRADPRPNGGSLFRIYRDVRFGKDKSPYKTSMGMQFNHVSGKNAHTPGFYMHIEPGGCFGGVGIWRPDGPTIRKIRDRIAGDQQAWRKAVGGKGFRENFSLHGDALKRVPRGYDPEHPLAEVLKLKDVLGLVSFTQKEVTAPGFVDVFAQRCADGAPLVKFICDAIEAPF